MNSREIESLPLAGCNGCLDLDDVKNGGLDKSVAELEGLWEQLRPFLR